MTRVAGRRPTRELWHFTCDHGRKGIGEHGILQPHQHILLPSLLPVVWLTSNARPARDDVGLTSQTLSCDRLAHRYRVTDSRLTVAWSAIRARHAAIAPDVVADLERYGEPSTWWLSFGPIRAELA